MGDSGSTDSWKKLVIAKANDQWVSISNVKKEYPDNVNSAVNTGNFSLDFEEETPYCRPVKTETVEVTGGHDWQANESPAQESDPDPLLIETKEIRRRESTEERASRESTEERASRLAKMSAYAAQRLANETPEQRAARLSRMSQYAARRLASETSEQRAKRLARMSAYAAKRLAQETPEQRRARLTRMSAYAAKRHARRKKNRAATKTSESNNIYEIATLTQQRSNES